MTSGPRLGGALISVLLLLSLAAGIAAEAQALQPFDRLLERVPSGEQAATLLAEMIRTPTVNPPGDERALARKLANFLGQAGIEHGVITTPSARGGATRAAVWARLRGTGDRPALALLSHLDTVPAAPTEWTVNPFAGEIGDGFVWGRGALDAKGVTVAHLMALVELARSEIGLERDVLFLATPDEETGGRNGAGWLVEHHPELFAGVGFLLTEGGGIQIARERDIDRPPIWGVALTEKSPCWLELRAVGRAGHSSSPAPDAAVPRLIAALDRIRRVESPLRVSEEVAQMFRSLAPIAADWDRAGYMDLKETLASDEGFRRRFLGSPSQNALVRNTVSITVLEGAPKVNVAPRVARAELDARLLPGESCEAFAGSLAGLISDPSVEISELLSFPARASSADSPLFRAIERVAANQDTPGLVVPRMISGFTDAHWFRDLGIVAYGFVPRSLTAEELGRVHGPDERVRVKTLDESIRLTVEVIRALDQIEAAEAR
jgi:acetylornithine deacetylase/succinyl-diaminopimelate desuccinylase-like protein